MGADQFSCTAKSKTATQAFNAAVNKAQYDHGHSGYTGTIAEKSEFVMIVPNEGESPEDCAERLTEERDKRIDDKWGPAGCIDCGNEKYLFFGWASS